MHYRRQRRQSQPSQPRTQPVRFPIGPLLRFEGRPYGDLAAILGVSRRTIERWGAEGISVWRADELAIKGLGVHPASIWSDWYERTPIHNPRETMTA